MSATRLGLGQVVRSLQGSSCRTSATYRSRARTFTSQQISGTRDASWPLLLSLAGVGGLGAYTYLNWRSPPNLEADVDRQEKAQGMGPGALVKDQWTPFNLEKVEPYNYNTNIYHFAFPQDSENKTSGLQVAGAILMKSPVGDDEVKDEKGKPVIRPYTPVSAPGKTGGLTLMIKEYTGGQLTPYISRLEPGKSTMLFKGPIAKYPYEKNTFDRGLCIAGGSGITPMWQLINYSLAMPDDHTKWTLVFSNISDKDILLKEEWDALAKKHSDRLEINYVVDKSSRGWKGETGYITAPMISKHFPRRSDDTVKAFVCGPPPQVQSICGKKDGPRQGELSGALKDLGYTSEEVFKF